ncbi:retrovirus-related pol polyprotein from transposon TNT 1-94 [Tanacetum coccineum]
MTDGDERKHVLDYTHVNLHYVEDQRKNLVNKFNLLKQEVSLHKSELSNLKNTVSINCSLQNEVIRVNLENESLKDEIIDLKKVIEKCTCIKVTLDQLLSDQVPGNIVKALGGKGRRKEKISSKELIGAAPSGTSESLISLSDLTLNMADLTLDTPVPKKTRPFVKVSPTYVIKKKIEKSHAVPKPCFDKKADSSTEQLLLTLMEEVKGLKRKIEIPSGTPPLNSHPSSSKATKQKTWFGSYKHCGFKNHLSDDCYSKPKCSTCGSTNHLTKEHLEHAVVKKTLSKLKAQSPLKPSPKKAPMIPKPFKECKYYGFNDHHSDHCEFYPGCEDYLKRLVWYLDSGCSRHMTGIKQYLHRYSKESGPKVVFGNDSSGDTEGYGSMNCNRITFTRVAYVNGLKHNLINISQLCDANYKVLFTKTQGTIYNQNDEVVLIAPRKRDVYVIDIKMENLNEVMVKQLTSDNRTEFRNYKLEEFCNEKEAVNTAWYTKNRSIIMKRHGNTSYDVFRGRSPDISYFHVFGCLVHIHNHRGRLGKFDEKADDGFFLGYSPMAKAFRVFNIRRQEMEEIVHVTFSEYDEAISQSSTKGDAVNFNENRSFPYDEFLEPRSEVTQCPGNTEYFPYIPAYKNNKPSESPFLQVSVTSEDPLEFTKADNHPTLNEPDQTEFADHFEPVEPQKNVIIKPINRWSREKHIELVNIIGEPLAGITTKSRIRDSDAASASECLYVNFLSEMEPKKLIEALEEEGFYGVPDGCKSAFLNGKISKEVYVQKPPGFESNEFPNHVCKLDKALYGLKQAPKAWYQANPKQSHLVVVKRIFRYLKGTPNLVLWYPKGSGFDPKGSGFDLKAYSDSDYAGCNLDRKSTLWGCHILGGKLVCWSAKKQSSVAMSSAEAEYVAAAGCCAQVLWIKSQLADYDVLYDNVPIFCDNTSFIAISNNPVLHSRTKHIDTRYHFIRDHILKGNIELHFVPTDLQLADIFIKPLAKPSFTRLVAELGMLNIEKHVSYKKKALSDHLT